MRWFGEPWPTADKRASVCEDDADRVPTPAGEHCAQCLEPIEDDDRGVVIPSWGKEGEQPYDCYWHLRCLLTTTLGEAMTENILSRMEAEAW